MPRSNEDYIRKAVELADGFQLTSDQAYFSLPHGGFVPSVKHVVEAEIFNQYKDALAAQLVRQVDALRSEDFQAAVEISFGCTIIWLNGTRTHSAHGPSRTMNTIKAIVDSEVLT